MKSPKMKTRAKFVDEQDLSDVLCEFDAVMEDFTSPVEKRHFRYDEHLKTAKRRSSASVSDSGISDTETPGTRLGPDWDQTGTPVVDSDRATGTSLTGMQGDPSRNSFSFSDERLNSPTRLSPATASPPLMSPKPKLGDTKELEDFIADLDRTLQSM